MHCAQNDCHILNQYHFFMHVSNFQNSGAGRSWEQAIIYGSSQTRNFSGHPLNMTVINGFFIICYNLIFDVSPDELSAKLNDFFQITHSQEGKEHPFFLYVCFMFWVRRASLMGKLRYRFALRVRFLGVILRFGSY